MDTAPVTLAELVSRGMLAIHEADRGPPLPRTAPTPPSADALGRGVALRSPPKSKNASLSEDTKRLVGSTDRLVERLKWLTTSAPDDPLLIRRHIMHCVELFLSDVCSKR